MRALIYSEAMNPDFSSEPGVTFNQARALVDLLDEAVVVTQVRNRDAINAVGMGRAHVEYIDTEYIAKPVHKITSALGLGTANRTAAKLPAYYAFERDLFRRFKADLRCGRFDIVHRLGPISSAIPSPMARWSPVPFVVGPVNGGLAYPPQFRDVLRKEKEWLRYVRNVNRLLPYAKATYSQSAAILAAFQHTIDHLPASASGKIFDMPEVGADPSDFDIANERPEKTALEFLFVGRLVPFKCADVVISAFAKSDILRNHELTIVGDGPERQALEAHAESLDLGARVNFLGWTDKDEVARRMRTSDAFVFPSIRDAGAGVIVEAMMSGLPVVAVDYGPGRHLLTEDTGIRVPLGTREQHITAFRAAMERLATFEDERRALGAAARQRAFDRLTWEAKAKHIVEIYKWSTGQRSERPGNILDT